MPVLTDTFPLASGTAIPKVGFGTWQIPEGDAVYDAVRAALDAGYRHIDTALAYGNERGVGRAVRDSGVDRDELFITTKLPAEIKDAGGARDAFERSTGNLDLGPVDLWLIHAPWPWDAIGTQHREGNAAVWRVMAEVHGAGRTKAIGVSNFEIADLEALIADTDVVPHVNQIRWHVGHSEPDLTRWCQEHDVLVEGYSPLATGRLFGTQVLDEIAARTGRTPAQVAIRYLLEHDVLPLPKSVTPHRIAENADLDFDLDPADVATLDDLNGR